MSFYRLSYDIVKKRSSDKGLKGVVVALGIATLSSTSVAQQNLSSEAQINEDGYLVNGAPSEFNNYSASFVKDWRKADPDYEDTEFGETMYNEASTPTKLEILRLLSKETPPVTVMMHAIAMGIDIEEVLQASINYQPNRASEMASSAVSLLPVLSDSTGYLYEGYELEDLEREDESKPFKVQEVIDRFFKDRAVLRPYPDWYEGQYHFLASAAELKSLQDPQKEVKWYRTKSTVGTQYKRPIFVALYEESGSVLVDGEDRIREALKQDPDALLPVVFVFNRLNERSVDELGYPATIKGAQDAFSEKGLMLTPTPEWQLGEYHMYADVAEFYEVFDIPEEEDFEPENWQLLLAEAEDYSVTDTSFILVVVSGSEHEENEDGTKTASNIESEFSLSQQGVEIATWDDPRTEGDFKYTPPTNGQPVTLKNILGKGVIFNRPDLLAALNALGVTRVPVSFYYIDSSRVKPFVKGRSVLLNAARGVIINPPSSGGSGGFSRCASPPCVPQ